MRFTRDMSVAGCKQIRDKFAEGGADHGLFQPTVPGKNSARWLKPERTLQYYDLQSCDEVHYRKRHRPVKLNPQTHIKKVKEDDIVQVHNQLTGMTESNAKYRYVQLCRSLKTYGITSYEVKEKKKGTKKLVPFCIGITRDSIIRMSYETKEIEKRWPLTHLRRWAASDKSFTLDFGDHEEDYMTLVTAEGEAISQLIGGYIDIILKRQEEIGRIEHEDDSSVATEEFLAPVRASAVSTIASSVGLCGEDAQQGRERILAPAQQAASVSGLCSPYSLSRKGAQSVAKKQGVGGLAAPISGLASALDDCKLLAQDLQDPQTAVLSQGEVPAEEWRQQLIANANAVGRSALDLLAQANQQSIDKSALDGLGKTVGLNLQDMINAARHAATGSEADLSLLLGARAVSEAVVELLKCAKDIFDKPNNQNARDEMRHAAEALQAAQIFLQRADRHHHRPDIAGLILQPALRSSSRQATTFARTISDQSQKVALTTGKASLPRRTIS